MNQHYKKLGFKTPKNYFQKSKDQILATNINYRTKKIEYKSTFQLLIAAVFITSILYLNFSSLNTESKSFSSKSPIISSIILNEEITEEYIVDYLTDKIAENDIYIPK
jgi:p-aminobenzoyl-glutamate transporter AbgT